MSVGASNLVLYGSATMPDNDSVQRVGGAINTKIKMEMAEISPSGRVEMLSVAGQSGYSMDISFRRTNGVAATELKNINGATVVTFAATMERILKLVASTSVHTGQITVRKLSGGTSLATLINGISQVRRPFYNAAAPDAGTKSYYEKIFYKNTHGTLALTSASIAEQADPSGKITFALDGVAAACPLNLSVNNGAFGRNTPPSGRITSFDSASKGVRNNNNLTQGSAQGIWMRLLLTNTDAATKTSYTLKCKGNST